MSKEEKIKADKYFADRGINPNVMSHGTIYGETKDLEAYPASTFNKDDEGVIDYRCEITVRAYLFYLYVTVSFEDSDGVYHEFIGHCGGIGAGQVLSVGVIYFGSKEILLEATELAVVFGGDGLGGVQVTWGTSGNATAAGVDLGVGAFGGDGSWGN